MSPVAVGARLQCTECGTEIIVVKGTDAEVSCCDKVMAPREGS
ncbi:MAG TPA: hypothetical protein VMX12_02900 [Acidimicrobiia bacterium]|nr:hypothetical protein [Acidimicrobiia bacterium]